MRAWGAAGLWAMVAHCSLQSTAFVGASAPPFPAHQRKGAWVLREWEH